MEYLNLILYCGSELEWKELVNKTWRNQALEYVDIIPNSNGNINSYSTFNVKRGKQNDLSKNIDIIYDYNENMKVNGSLISCYYDNDTVTANVKLNYIMEDCKVILAIYDDDGRMVTLTEDAATVEDSIVSISCPADESYVGCNIKVMFWNSLNNLKPVGNVVTGEVKEMILESQHPYEDHCDETQVYTYNGDCESISITFSYDTQTESGCDYIYIYDMNDNELGAYDGTELSGQTVTIPGNGFKIRLTSDEGINYYGYKIKNIVVNN